MSNFKLHRFCTAPMLGATDRHFRQFVRYLSNEAFLYSELVHCHAITKGNYHLELSDNAKSHPSALQLAGSSPEDMGQAAFMAYQNGFDEINLNIGCPSPKGVVSNFGLCLMEDAELTAACVKACVKACPIPVTVKCRLGSRMDYTLDELLRFLELNMEAGCRCFIIHARRADLNKYDTVQNRNIPPIEYETVYNLKEKYPETEWIINGDIKTLEQAQEHLQHTDGVMMGRSLYHNIYLLSQVSEKIFGKEKCTLSRADFIKTKVIPYIEEQMEKGKPLAHFVRHLLSLYQHQNKANTWRRFLAENAYKPGASADILLQALELVEGE